MINLFRFTDWLMSLPKELDQAFWQEVQEYEEAKRMTYITSVERIGIEKGIKQGMQQGLEQGITRGLQQGRLDSAREGVIDILATRFEIVPDDILKAIEQIENITTLRHLHKKAVMVGSLQEFIQLLPEPMPGAAQNATP